MTDLLAPLPADRNAYSEYAAERVQLLHARVEEDFITETEARSEIAGIVYHSTVPVDSATRFLRDSNQLSDINVTDLADKLRELLVDKILDPGDNGFCLATAALGNASPTGWAAKFADGRFGAQHLWRCITRARKYGVPFDPQPTCTADGEGTKGSLIESEVDVRAEMDFTSADNGGMQHDLALDLCAHIVSRRNGLRTAGRVSRAARALVLGFGLPEPERPEQPDVRERLLDELREKPEAALEAMQAVLSGEIPEDDRLTGLWSSFNVRHLTAVNGYGSREEIAYNLAYAALSPVRPLPDEDKRSLRAAVAKALPDEPQARRLSGKLITCYADARAEIGSEFTSLDTPEPKTAEEIAQHQAELEEVAATVVAAYPRSPLGSSIAEAIAFLDRTRREIEHGGMATLFQTAGEAA